MAITRDDYNPIVEKLHSNIVGLNEAYTQYQTATMNYRKAEKEVEATVNKLRKLFINAQFMMTKEMLSAVKLNNGIKSGKLTKINIMYFLECYDENNERIRQLCLDITQSSSSGNLPLITLIKAIDNGSIELIPREKRKRKVKDNDIRHDNIP